MMPLAPRAQRSDDGFITTTIVKLQLFAMASTRRKGEFKTGTSDPLHVTEPGVCRVQTRSVAEKG